MWSIADRHARLVLFHAWPGRPCAVVHHHVDTWMWPFVMLICLAGLRSIPDYITRPPVDRVEMAAVPAITVPMVLLLMWPCCSAASKFQDVRMLTCFRRRPRRNPDPDRLKQRHLKSGARASPCAYAIILFVTVSGLASIYVKARTSEKDGAYSSPNRRSCQMGGRGNRCCLHHHHASAAGLDHFHRLQIGPDSISYPPKVFYPTLRLNLPTAPSGGRKFAALPPRPGMMRLSAIPEWLLPAPAALANASEFGHHRLRLYRAVHLPGIWRLCLQPLQGAAEGRPSVLHPVTRMMPPLPSPSRSSMYRDWASLGRIWA